MGAPAVTVSAPVPGPGPAWCGRTSWPRRQRPIVLSREMFHSVRASGRDRALLCPSAECPPTPAGSFQEAEISYRAESNGVLNLAHGLKGLAYIKVLGGQLARRYELLIIGH